MKKLSPRRRDILDFIQTYRHAYGKGPKLEEIAEGVGYNDAASAGHALRNLERDGYIERVPYQPRGIVLGSQCASERDVIAKLHLTMIAALDAPLPDALDGKCFTNIRPPRRWPGSAVADGSPLSPSAAYRDGCNSGAPI
jgi:hypothetical protein